MDRRWPAAGLVHGYSVAFALGAGMLALGAIVSAVFVTGQSRRGRGRRSAPAGGGLAPTGMMRG